MANPGTRILSVLLASAAAAWCAWQFIPGTTLDRGLARLVSRTITKPPIALSGNGGHESPWILLQPSTPKPGTSDLTVVSLGDDPEGIFQSSPPSPLDLAIVLKNIRRLEVADLGISAVLAWENPDVIALSALDSAMGAFGKVATAAPLSRGPTSAPLPASFRRASLAADKAKGNIADLPVVNRIPLPGIILGQDNAFSGFTLLENEPDGVPLAARWDDRIVFAFPVVAAVVQQGLSIDDIELVPGSHLKLGSSGSVIPIDRYGRLVSPGETIPAGKSVNAASLADAKEPLATGSRKFTLLRDDQSGAEPPTRRFSETVVARIEAMTSDGAAPEARIFRRAPASSELALLGALCLAIAAVSLRPGFSRLRIHLLVGVIGLALQFVLAITSSFWFVALPMTAASVGAFAVSRIFFKEQPSPVLMEEAATTPVAPPVVLPSPNTTSEPVAIDPIPPETPAVEESNKSAAPARKPAAKKAAKKAAVKKTAAKKSAAKKAAGKKTARTRKPKNSS